MQHNRFKSERDALRDQLANTRRQLLDAKKEILEGEIAREKMESDLNDALAELAHYKSLNGPASLSAAKKSSANSQTVSELENNDGSDRSNSIELVEPPASSTSRSTSKKKIVHYIGTPPPTRNRVKVQLSTPETSRSISLYEEEEVVHDPLETERANAGKQTSSSQPSNRTIAPPSPSATSRSSQLNDTLVPESSAATSEPSAATNQTRPAAQRYPARDQVMPTSEMSSSKGKRKAEAYPVLAPKRRKPDTPSTPLASKHSTTSLAALRAEVLARCTPFEIVPPLSSYVEFRRDFLAARYGINNQQMSVRISAQRNPVPPGAPSSDRHVVLPIFGRNPYLPKKPGDAGFLFTARHKGELAFDCASIFVRRTSASVWEYTGEYKLTYCETVKGQLYEELPMEVRKSLECDALSRKSHFSKERRGRIAHRLGLRVENLTATDIRKAIVNEEEEAIMMLLQPVGYDRVFADHMQMNSGNNSVVSSVQAPQASNTKTVKARLSLPKKSRIALVESDDDMDTSSALSVLSEPESPVRRSIRPHSTAATVFSDDEMFEPKIDEDPDDSDYCPQ